MSEEPDAEELVATKRVERLRDWQIAQMVRLGVPYDSATLLARHVSWRDVARRLEQGCPAELLTRILL